MSKEKHEINYSLAVKTIHEFSLELRSYFEVQIRVLETVKTIQESIKILESHNEAILESLDAALRQRAKDWEQIQDLQNRVIELEGV